MCNNITTNTFNKHLLNGYCGSNTDASTYSETIKENSVYRCSYYSNGGIESCIKGKIKYCTRELVAGTQATISDCQESNPDYYGILYKCYTFDNYIGKCFKIH